MPQAVEILHAQIGTPGIVCGDTALGLVPQILAEKHHGHLIRVWLQVLAAMVFLRDDQDPVNLPVHQQLDHRPLLPEIRRGVAQHDVVASGLCPDLRIICQLRHVVVVDGRDHQSDQVRLLHDHGARDIVLRIAHLVTQPPDPLPGLPPDLRTVRKGTGDGGIGDSCRPGHILQRDALHLAPPFCIKVRIFANVSAFLEKIKHICVFLLL